MQKESKNELGPGEDTFIEWDDERYSTAIERFDEQHRRLFELLNELYVAMEEGRSEEAVGDILRELERYTEYHFGDEEEFMQDCGFAIDCADCFYDHRDMHDEFAQKVSELREKHENGEYISMEVLMFARDWLDSHIAGLNQDQNYSEYYEEEVSEDYEYGPGKLKAGRDSDPHPEGSVEITKTSDSDSEPREGQREPATVEDDLSIATTVDSDEQLTVPPEPLAKWLETTVNEYGDRTATVTIEDGDTKTRAFEDIYRESIEVAGGLLDLGLEPGDRVGIRVSPRPKWAVVEFACLLSGLVSVPVSDVFDDDRTRHVLEDAGVDVLVTDEEPAEQVRSNVDQVIPVDEMPTASSGTLPGLEAQPNDVATILYRVGTREHPNGCAITHRNLRATVEMLDSGLPLDPGATGTSFLPLAHPYQRLLNYHLWNSGGSVAYIDRDCLLAELKAVEPTVLVGVPAVYERLYEEVRDRREQYSGLKQALSNGVARSVGAAKNDNESVSTHLSVKHSVAERTVFSNLRKTLGLANLSYALTGTAPIETDLLAFFRGFGVPLSEVYGATELTGFATLNVAGEYDPESVGKPVSGIEVGVAPDNEVVVRGPNVIEGYWNDSLTWREKFVDGWYRTGDLGRVEEGVLFVDGPK